jgi:hypothetical protein
MSISLKRTAAFALGSEYLDQHFDKLLLQFPNEWVAVRITNGKVELLNNADIAALQDSTIQQFWANADEDFVFRQLTTRIEPEE